jgi:peptidoglycan/xylan/chitin deacetylase (PgdA/CDA1 family)
LRINGFSIRNPKSAIRNAESMSRFSYHTPILGYHRVGPWRGDHVPTVSPAAFERQLAILARHRYRVLSLEDLVTRFEQGGPMPRHSVVITFDDGYAETHTVAWPLLRRLGFPATVFVTPNEVGSPGFMSWSQVQEIAQDGMTVGSHTMHHRYLPLVDTARLPEEIVASKSVIEERIGRAVHFISYPIGGFTAAVLELVEQAGYRAACTTNRASPRAPRDRFALRRVKITERDAHPLLLLAKTSGYYDAFRQLKRPH